jgi:hypothetical protein
VISGALAGGEDCPLAPAAAAAATRSDFREVKGGNMRRSARFSGLGAVLILGAALMLLTTFASAASSGGAQHVRWDIISTTGIPPAALNPGGSASAKAPDGETITLTGSGHFVAPGSGGGSGAVDGGGTWTTSSGGSGDYVVTRLVDWEFANYQADVGFVDNIDEGRRANGTAVLAIEFSNGLRGVLTVGCHGPGAPPGIFEGIATTKGFRTYYDVQPPTAGVDANRTLFHVR